MKLLVGLGNFEKKYDDTRHNIGFEMIEVLAKTYNFPKLKLEGKFFGKISRGQIKNEKIVLLKPETFMNISGKAVQAVRNFYKIPVQDVLVFFDDIDTDFGEIRFREKGGSGGHNGIKSIISVIGGEEFARVKFGICNEFRKKMNTADFVLQKFSKQEKEELPEILKKGLKKYLENVE